MSETTFLQEYQEFLTRGVKFSTRIFDMQEQEV